MIKIFDLINMDNENSLKLEICDENICFDSPVKVIFENHFNKYLLLEDILGYAITELYSHFYKIDDLELPANLLEKEIGRSQNEYYHCCAEALPLLSLDLQEVNNIWIGSKYCCFESKLFSTWLYKIKDKIYFKITPLYPWHFSEEYEYSYSDFQMKYKIVYEKCLSANELLQCQKVIHDIKKIM